MFEFIVNSESMKKVCDCVRFGNGEAVTTVFRESNGKTVAMFLCSDGITMGQSSAIVAVNGTVEPFNFSNMLFDIVNSMYTYGESIVFSVEPTSGVNARCGKAKNFIPVVEKAKGISMSKEDAANCLRCIVDTDDFLKAVRIGGLFSDYITTCGPEILRGSICIRFDKGELGYIGELFSTSGGLFTSISSFKIESVVNSADVENFNEADFIGRFVIIKGNQLMALRNVLTGDKNNQIQMQVYPKHVKFQDIAGVYTTTCILGQPSDQFYRTLKMNEYTTSVTVDRKMLKNAMACAHVGVADAEKDTFIIEGISGNFNVRSHDGRQNVELDVEKNDGSDCLAVLKYDMTMKAVNALFGDELTIYMSNRDGEDWVGIARLFTDEKSRMIICGINATTVAKEIKKRQQEQVEKKKKKLEGSETN